MNIPLISFFTGGGFLDLGFEQAGFDVRWTNEYNAIFAAIYERGMTAWRKSISPDAKTATISSKSNIAELKGEQILAEAFPDAPPRIFGVIGGPPCTDFSVGGRNAGHEGDAGRMTSVYVKMLGKLKPAFFLLENVPNLHTNEKHVPEFDRLIRALDKQYATVINTLNALEYGAPQDRRRLIVIGFRRDLLQDWFLDARQVKRTLEINFSCPKPTHPGAKTKYTWPSTFPFGQTPKVPAEIPMQLCTWQAVCSKPFPHTLPNGKEYFTPHSKKFSKIAEGDVAGKSFKRLHRYRYSPTAWYGNNEVHLHPFEPRRLSVREALRIQTVPDAYVMPSDVPLSSKFKVIGNGVPCVLARALADYIKQFIIDRESRLSSPAVTQQASR